MIRETRPVTASTRAMPPLRMRGEICGNVGVTAVLTIRGLLNGLQDGIVRTTVEAQTGAPQVHRTGYLANVLAAPLSLEKPARVGNVLVNGGLQGLQAVVTGLVSQLVQELYAHDFTVAPFFTEGLGPIKAMNL